MEVVWFVDDGGKCVYLVGAVTHEPAATQGDNEGDSRKAGGRCGGAAGLNFEMQAELFNQFASGKLLTRSPRAHLARTTLCALLCSSTRRMNNRHDPRGFVCRTGAAFRSQRPDNCESARGES